MAALALACLLASAAPPVSAAEARALGELITISVARHKAFDVLSSADMRRVVELEADKATMGCSDAGSCLAELAGAMGARYVVFGQVATLGAQIVLTLNLFDSSLGSSSGRVVIYGARVDEIFSQIDPRIDALVADAVAAGGDRVRVLVLDLERTEAAPAPVVESAPLGVGFWMLAGGVTAAGGGAPSALGGAYFGAGADEAHNEAQNALFQDDRVAALSQRDGSALAANLLYGASAVLAAGGAALVVAAFFVGEDP
jgi:TolB-like protein